MDRDKKIMEELMDDSLSFKKIKKGSILKGEIISSLKDEIVVNINYFCDGIVRKEELLKDIVVGETYLKGQQIDVFVVSLDDGFGNVLLSEKKAYYENAINELREIYKNGKKVEVFVKEEVNAEEATKYEGVIARDTLAETMQSVGTTKNLEALLAGIDMTSDQLYEGLSDVKVAVWINAEGYPVKYEMDMTEMTQGLMRKVMQTSGVSAQEAAKLDVSTAKLSIINKNINNVTDFEIPEKAILATEVSL